MFKGAFLWESGLIDLLYSFFYAFIRSLRFVFGFVFKKIVLVRSRNTMYPDYFTF